MLFRRKLALGISAFILSFFFLLPAKAMPLGTLLYRTSGDGNLYGYNTTELVRVKNGIIRNVYTGHVAIYVGEEDGVDYIVEATANGIVKTPAKYFLNSNNNEYIIGAKIPKNLSEAQRLKVVELAKNLAEANLAYDFDFKKQKGPNDGEWICVGLTEKLYESANISNPFDLSQLEYDPSRYGVDITPDGFDNFSVINNESGDCLSKQVEFSKIEAEHRSLLPLPEIFGFNSGLEYGGERYFFFPITQYWQNSLENVAVDIQIESAFVDDEIRGSVPEISMIFKWSLVNNPNSSINRIINNIIALFSKSNSGNSNNSSDINDDYNEEEDDEIEVGEEESNISEDDLDIFDKDDEDEEEEDDDINIDDLEESSSASLLISKIYTTAKDDYIELYNFSEQAIDLAALNIRLYKTKTSASPTLMMRIGNDLDGTYPGGTIIEPQGRYLIARADASDEIKNQASAIASRSSFTLSGNGYTIYLGQGVVSSDDDEDIIDKVGYGDATYFKTSPAPAILDNHLLIRKAKASSDSNSMSLGGSDYLLGSGFNSNNNAFDFVLVSLISNEVSGDDNDSEEGSEEPENPIDQDDNNSIPEKAKLLISKVYTTLKDDYIELYNFSEQAIDLAALNIRLYKTKTSVSPTLMMRIGNDLDGIYPGGTIIEPQGRYLIARADASDEIKNQASAIASRSSFTLSGNGYTIYLGQGVVSSDDEEDIIDKVGYGDATYFKLSPAPLIPDNHLLIRKAKASSDSNSMSLGGSDYLLGSGFNSGNNAFDFLLLNLGEGAENNDNEEGDIDTPNDDEANDNTEENEVSEIPQLLISKIYTTNKDDYLEIYNPNDFDIDLAEYNIRFHKTITGLNPNLMIRIGNDLDGYYPGGTIVEAQGRYLIARVDASDEIKDQASAIATRSDFSLSGGAYTVYLASGPVSSDDDEDIIDKVGYGDATYFKTSPAPAILDNHLLIRKAKADSSADSMVLGGIDYLLGSGFNSDNNALDFVLINLEIDDNEDQEEPFIPGQDNDGEFFNYCIDPGLYLNNIIHLWHFDECLASSTFDFADNKILPVDSIWRAGKFGCALEQNHQQGSVSTELDSSFDSNNFSLSFYYQNLADNSRPTITFSNSVSGNFFRIQLYPSYTDFYNFPQQIERRDRDLIWIDDASWHLFTLVVNKPENYWAIYRDGEEIKRVEMKTKKFIEVDRFSLKGDNYNNLADELVIFNRALSPNEVRQINEADIPLNTKTCRTISPQTPEIIHYWSFDENLGNIAYDVVGQSHMSILPEARIIGDSVNNYLKVSSAFPEILVDLVNPSPRTDLALAFWWKSNDLSQNNSLLKLMTNNENLFGLNINHGSWYYYFNNMNIRASNESLVPNDGFWHNIVLSYSSYWMKLNIYVDGELKASIRRNWLYNKSLRKMLIKSLEGSHYLDEISIWNWSLNLADVKTIYNLQKEYFTN